MASRLGSLLPLAVRHLRPQQTFVRQAGLLGLNRAFNQSSTRISDQRARLYSTRATGNPYDGIAVEEDHHNVGSPVGGDPAKRAFAYMVMGTSGFMYAAALRSTVVDFIDSMNPSADVLAMASIEVELDKIAVGDTLVAKWRGKPVFIRRRTEAEISAARDPSVELKDPQQDEARVKEPEWLIVIGVCTHLGCVPISGQGEYGGWFCPCHGSHYDTSGRIRKGPAPLNLEVPPYAFIDNGTKVRIG
eukprot:TRINITY_DN783_c0_g1_i1.p1 TRINITY_DN783_c0_g1~~TRINITY_DN783_c0_g1_i1.p1  ORF type:complete len:253 (+),score=36.52 TRINITY_DN783_c0_g1_i1:23-760(+)